jgi:hypothetical protein
MEQSTRAVIREVRILYALLNHVGRSNTLLIQGEQYNNFSGKFVLTTSRVSARSEDFVLAPHCCTNRQEDRRAATSWSPSCHLM